MDGRAVWTEYWRGEGQRGGAGCLPGATPELGGALAAFWQQHTAMLRPGSAVLDIATGNGAVLATIATIRADISLFGTDLADSLPVDNESMTLCGGVDHRALPFDAARFALITSQFGFEYIHDVAVLRECHRVIAPGGCLAFILHDATSPIVRQNAARRESLAWILTDALVIDAALACAAQGHKLDPAGIRPFEEALQQATSRFGTASPATEICLATGRCLMGLGIAPADEITRALHQLKTMAKGEAQRIALLESAALDEEKLARYCDWLDTAGFADVADGVIATPDAPAPLARTLTARRP